MKNKFDVLIVMGPTCSGKSDFAIKCAKLLNGEIISADSMQIYKELNIGSAKISDKEMQGIPHHLLSYISAFDEYSAQQFQFDTREKIKEIIGKNKTPIIVGGTGLFIKGLVENFNFGDTPKNEITRKKYLELSKENGLSFIYDLLSQQDPEMAQKIKPNDEKRIIRALEILDEGKIVKKTCQEDLKFLIVALDVDRENLYEKINHRVDEMMNRGLLNEVKELLDSGLNEEYQSFKGIGYKEFLPYFKKEKSVEECVELIKQHTRNYAKRQKTWIRGMNDIVWLDPNQSEIACKMFRGENL